MFQKIISWVIAAVVVLVALFVVFNKSIVSFVQGLPLPKQADVFLQNVQTEINTPGALVAKIQSDNAYLTDQGVFVLTNAERTKMGEKTLALNGTLTTIAERRLADMFAKGYFEHVSPTGQSAVTVAGDVGYQYITIGENIAMGNFENDAVLVAAWMASPGHRANILNVKYSEIGVAVGKGLYNGSSTWIAVQVFALPLSSCPAIDAGLKDDIDTKTATITTEQSNMQAMQSQMTQLKDSGHLSEYNALVDEYNSEVQVFNSSIMEVKNLINQYNTEVQAFNACAQNPS